LALGIERFIDQQHETNGKRQLSGALVLIVERDEVVRKLQRHFLEQSGYIAQFVDDGEAAFETARHSLPSLIVTEILIPKMDGLALCRRLGSDPLTQHIPVIVFSILNAAARATEAGAQAFLRKPLVGSTFLGTIKRLVAAQPSVTLEQ
jgi:CheY-like chemotaxis protein